MDLYVLHEYSNFVLNEFIFICLYVPGEIMFIVRSTLVFIVVTIVIATENFNCLVRNSAHGSNNDIRMVRIAVIK